MKINYYAVFNKDINVRLKSSSGGVFHDLAKFILDKQGIVFGAAFDKNWFVEMKYVENEKDLQSLMKSKYILADTKKTFVEAKKFLDRKRLVLYAGTSCQIHALKQFLKCEYTNLFCVEIVCHGIMPKQIWADYLNSIKRKFKKIVSIDFRDKNVISSNGKRWLNNYYISIRYSDQKTITQPVLSNKYMQTFLSDEYLLPSCYNCQFKNQNSKADLTIGDYWSVDQRHKELNDGNGISIVVSRTDKGEELLNNCNNLQLSKMTSDDYTQCGGGVNSIINKAKRKYTSNIFKKPQKKVGIISLPLDTNYGGVIQSYVLQEVIEKFGYHTYTVSAHTPGYPNHLPFADKYMHLKMLPFSKSNYFVPYHLIGEHEFDTIVIGSDQIWRGEWENVEEIFLGFTTNWKLNRFVYAASFGVPEWQYNENDTKRASFLLKNIFNGVSVRELDAIDLCEKHFGITPILTLDPVFLVDISFYINLCQNVKQKSGFFTYLVGPNEEKNNIITNFKNKTNYNEIEITSSVVEEWLAAFRDAEFIITDSFHGIAFSLLFNKPFLSFYNEKGGNSRFETLIKQFNIANRFIKNVITDNQLKLLRESVVFPKSFYKLKKESLRFLKQNLKKAPNISTNQKINKPESKNRIKKKIKIFFPTGTRRWKFAKFFWVKLKKFKIVCMRKNKRI